MSELYLGIDTSCYTTSVACVNDNGIVCDERTVLSVSLGERGLRQSEGLFQHVRNLPFLIEKVMAQIDPSQIKAIAVSSKPTALADSYMPVFLAGEGQARALSASLSVPLIRTNHQSGHIRAALKGNESLIDHPFYAIHLSGGTTDVLSVAEGIDVTPLGKSTDLHAGQLVDRIGVLLGCSFPSGKELERLACTATDKTIKIPSSVKEVNCSFSGAESALIRLHQQGINRAELSYALYDCLCRTLSKIIKNLYQLQGECSVLLCGGVASSLLLRKLLLERIDASLFFSDPKLASDNAVGVALIANSSNA